MEDLICLLATVRTLKLMEFTFRHVNLTNLNSKMLFLAYN